jgi:hypothetical protein
MITFLVTAESLLLTKRLPFGKNIIRNRTVFSLEQ